jgi:hypothetical protein
MPPAGITSLGLKRIHLDLMGKHYAVRTKPLARRTLRVE